MDKIYKDSDGQYVNFIVVYMDNEFKAYSDSSCTIPMTTEELKNAYDTGCVIRPKDSTMEGNLGSWNPIFYRPAGQGGSQVGSIGIIMGQNASVQIKLVNAQKTS